MPLRAVNFPIIVLLTLLILVSGCLAPKSGEKSANCPDGFAFDAKSRSCLAAGRAPQGITTNITLSEDAIPGYITLPYTDANGDQAVSCEVQNPFYTGLFTLGACSCSAGICQVPFAIVNYTSGGHLVFENGQGYFSYTVTDATEETSEQNKVNVTIVPVNDAPVLTIVPDNASYTLQLLESTTTYESGIVNRMSFSFGARIQSSDPDNFNSNLGDDDVVRYEIKPHSSNTTATISGCLGSWGSGGGSVLTGCTFQVNEELALASSKDYRFVVRGYDGEDYSAESEVVVRVVFNKDDAPTISYNSTASVSEDTELTYAAITITDIDTDLTLAPPICSITALNELMQTSMCTCSSTASSSSCSVKVLPVADFSGTANFTLNATVAGVAATSRTVSVNVSAVSDKYVAPLANMYILESSNFVAKTYNNASVLSTSGLSSAGVADSFYQGNNFATLTAVNPDGGSVPGTITVYDLPAGLSSVSCSSLTSCQFTIDDGNAQGMGAYAQSNIVLGVGGAAFRLRALATGAHNIRYQFLFPTQMPSGAPVVKVDGLDLIIYLASTHSVGDVLTAINNNAKARLLVIAEDIGDDLAQLVSPTPTGLLTLPGGIDPLYTLKYKVGAGTTKETTFGRIAINVVPVNDTPVICRPTPFSYDLSTINGCPETGCVGDASPIDAGVVPKMSGLLYYSKDKGICYRSNLSATSKWEVATSGFIPDQAVNEKDVVIIENIKLHEGGGGENDVADTMEIRLKSGTTTFSSNQLLIPDSSVNLKFLYNNVELTETTPGSKTYSVVNGGQSIHHGNFAIKITPVGTLTGSSTISFALYDGANEIATSFNVTVNASSAQHKGWKSVASQGPELDRFNQVVGSKACTFSLNHCQSGGVCTGTSKPTYDADSSEDNVIFYDSGNNKCYAYDSSGASVATRWQEISTYCPISSSLDEPNCDGASCYNSGSPGFTPTKVGLSYVNSATGECYRSVGTSSAADWKRYMGAGSVTLTWETFTLSGTGVISGHNVYRKLKTETNFDYTKPLNKTPLSSATRSFVDGGVNSFSPPLQGTVYEYEVRPIINAIPTQTNEIFKKMRVIVPNANQSFVHRDIVNKTMCTMLAATDIDSANHNRCTYTGFGSKIISGRSYYDIGNDLIVDRHEMGCNYSKSGCDTVDGACIGMSNPTTGGGLGDLFYNRSSGQCFFHNGATWQTLNNVIPLLGGYRISNRTPEAGEMPLNSTGLPPLVNIDWPQAQDLCTMRLSVSGDKNDSAADYEYIHGLTTVTDIAQTLPSRREQIAYSLWDTSTLTSSTITTREAGLSLNSSPKCNSSQASGLSGGYSDSDTPDSSSIYSLPGTASSNIRSVATGNSYTSTCSSLFGVRDHIGNVKEWTRTGIECGHVAGAPNQCRGLATDFTIGAFTYPGDKDLVPMYDTLINNSRDPEIPNYFLDNVVGYCGEDTNNNGLCDDTPITSWLLKNGNTFGLNVQSFNVPMGLPLLSNITTTFRPMPFTYGVYDDSVHDCDNDSTPDGLQSPAPSCSFVTMFATAINSPSLTVSDLHEDGVTFNIADILAGPATNKRGFMATGGSYLDGNAAGVWAFETVPEADTRSDVGMRCIIKVGESNYQN